MLQIRSREHLARQADLVPYVENLASRMLGGGSAPRVEATRLERSPTISSPGWVVLVDHTGRGVGICTREVAQGQTALRRRVDYARCAAQLATLFSARESAFRVRALDQETCPSEWSAYRVSVGNDELWCAVSYPPPELQPESAPRPAVPRHVRLRMRGWCEPQGDGLDGVLGECQKIHVQIEDQRGRYELRVTQGGAMIVTKVEDEQVSATSDSLGVRLDLGEIEIALDELLTLRAGSSIELATEGPLRCFLRVGATTLAAGEIAVSGETLTIRVTEMIHAE